MRLILFIILIILTGRAVLAFNPNIGANISYAKRHVLSEVCPPSADTTMCRLLVGLFYDP